MTGVLHRVDRARTREIAERVPLLMDGSGCASTAPDCLRFSGMLLRRGGLDGVYLLKPRPARPAPAAEALSALGRR